MHFCEEVLIGVMSVAVICWWGCGMLVSGVEHVHREGTDMLDRKRSNMLVARSATCWWIGYHSQSITVRRVYF